MDLGRARKQLAEDPDRAAETIDAALLQARETVDELRSLSRGIAPPLLVDRGLAAALGELTVRSEVPVEATIDVPDTLPPHVETAVYFVVAEALTNVAKHSGATRASVGVWMENGGVEVRVEDDGVGGAHPAKGSGLAGLQQRVLAADGRLEVSSPGGRSDRSLCVAHRIPRRVRTGGMRIVVADDSLLLREGLQLLLAEAGHEVVAAVGDGPAYVARDARAPAGRRRGRRPDAAQPHRRGAAGRGRRAPGLAGRADHGALAVRRGVLRRRPARLGRRRRRLPAQGPGQRPRRLPRRAGHGGRRAAPCSTRRWSPS